MNWMPRLGASMSSTSATSSAAAAGPARAAMTAARARRRAADRGKHWRRTSMTTPRTSSGAASTGPLPDLKAQQRRHRRRRAGLRRLGDPEPDLAAGERGAIEAAGLQRPALLGAIEDGPAAVLGDGCDMLLAGMVEPLDDELAAALELDQRRRA